MDRYAVRPRGQSRASPPGDLAPSMRSRQLEDRNPAREVEADAVAGGGGPCACAAALALARNGLTVVMTEETDWIGGQLTQQAVPPDEHPWIESFGCTRSYREFRSRVRDYYRRNYPLTG